MRVSARFYFMSPMPYTGWSMFLSTSWRVSLPTMTLLLAIRGFAAAQADLPIHQMPLVPAELLTRAIPLHAGIGVAHDTVLTSSAEAQRYYDQGLSYLHNYVWIEAARSFNQALRIDPQLSLAHVGVSLAVSGLNQRAAARAAIDRARQLAPAGLHEQHHLTVRECQIDAEEHPGDRLRMAGYRRALDAALALFPTDAELWLQRGVAEAVEASDRGQGSPPSAMPFYTKVLTLVPDHFAAHHYLTHALENGGRIEEALAHGSAYARLAPEIPHARHMYGHDLRRVGRIRDAIAEFQAADRLETAYFSTEHVAPDNDWHHEHNLDLLGTSYQYTGQLRLAAPLLERAFGLSTSNLVQAVNKRQWPAFLRAQGRSDQAMAAARLLGMHPHPVVQAIAHIEVAHALLASRRMTEAVTEINAAAAVLRTAGAGAGLASTGMQLLQGEFFLRSGQREKGRRVLRAAIAQARRAPGPDEWTQALFILESIARAAREADDWIFAGSVAEQMLAHDPSYAGSHYAAALAADHAGDGPRALREFDAAARLWIAADVDLLPLVDIRRRLAVSRERQ